MSNTGAQQGSESLLHPQAPDSLQLAAKTFARAQEAAQRGEYDYAIELFEQCCNYAPDNLLFRRALRATARRQYEENGGRKRRIRRLWAKGRIYRARFARNDRWLTEACERVLAYDPVNTAVLLEQARGFRRLGYVQLAVWNLETILQADPEHSQAARELAHAYEQRGAYEEACRLWEMLRKQNPRDEESRQRWRALQENIAGQLADARSETSDSSVDEVAVKALVTLPRRESHEGHAAASPVRSGDSAENVPDVDRLLELARRRQATGDFDAARQSLHQAMQVSGGDLRVQEQWEELEADVLRYRLAQAQQLAQSTPGDERLQKQLQALKTELNDYELDLYRRRSERYPGRAGLKYEFGLRLIRAGLLDEAVLQLSAAREDPQLHLKATLELAGCFRSQGDVSQARWCYHEALREASAWDDAALLDKVRRLLAELT